MRPTLRAIACLLALLLWLPGCSGTDLAGIVAGAGGPADVEDPVTALASDPELAAAVLVAGPERAAAWSALLDQAEEGALAAVVLALQEGAPDLDVVMAAAGEGLDGASSRQALVVLAALTPSLRAVADPTPEGAPHDLPLPLMDGVMAAVDLADLPAALTLAAGAASASVRDWAPALLPAHTGTMVDLAAEAMVFVVTPALTEALGEHDRDDVRDAAFGALFAVEEAVAIGDLTSASALSAADVVGVVDLVEGVQAGEDATNLLDSRGLLTLGQLLADETTRDLLVGTGSLEVIAAEDVEERPFGQLVLPDGSAVQGTDPFYDALGAAERDLLQSRFNALEPS